MTIDSLNAAFNVTGRLSSDAVGASGSIQQEIRTDLGPLNLDALYTREFTNANLDGTTVTFDSFPNVELGGSVVAGDDKQALLLNGIHVIAIKVVALTGLTPAGYITLTINKLGNESGSPPPTVQKLVAGDSFIAMTERGWPANAASAITISGTSDLANVKVLFALAGHTTTTGTGYAS